MFVHVKHRTENLVAATYIPVGYGLHDDGRREDVVVVALPLVGVGEAAENPQSPVGQDDAGRVGARRRQFEILAPHGTAGLVEPVALVRSGWRFNGLKKIDWKIAHKLT